MRKCKDCGLESTAGREALKMFVSDKGSREGKRNLCKACQYRRNKIYTEANPDKVSTWKSEHQINKRYGIDLATYNIRMSSASSCGICSKEDTLVYDHDHDTMEFRGILCRQCNASLGGLGDTKEAVENALAYLKA